MGLGVAVGVGVFVTVGIKVGVKVAVGVGVFVAKNGSTDGISPLPQALTMQSMIMYKVKCFFIMSIMSETLRIARK